MKTPMENNPVLGPKVREKEREISFPREGLQAGGQVEGLQGPIRECRVSSIRSVYC